MMRVSEMPHSERPASRIQRIDPAAMSVLELLAIVIGGTNARAAAEAAYIKCDSSLRRMAREWIGALEIPGVGDAASARVVASLELGRRLAAEGRDDGVPLRSPRDVARLMAPRLEDSPVEEFRVLCLDAQYRLERDVLITRGTLTSSLVHPREVFREAIKHGTAAIILVHNHPSGDPTPSADDRLVTEQLVAAGKLLDIRVNDHVIIGRGRYTSFAEQGLL